MPQNIAKCKLCGDTIQSFFDPDLVHCKCGEISVWGGLSMHCAFKNIENFLRVDDLGNTISVKYKKKEETYEDECPEGSNSPLDTRESRIEELKRIIDHTTSLPSVALQSYVTHTDLVNFMLLVHSILVMKN